MRVDKLTLERIFERTERLKAPPFQRPYVWRRERNWQPLWDAIERVAELFLAGGHRVLASLPRSSSTS